MPCYFSLAYLRQFGLWRGNSEDKVYMERENECDAFSPSLPYLCYDVQQVVSEVLVVVLLE